MKTSFINRKTQASFGTQTKMKEHSPLRDANKLRDANTQDASKLRDASELRGCEYSFTVQVSMTQASFGDTRPARTPTAAKLFGQ